MPHTLPPRPRPSHTSPRMSSVRPLTRARPVSAVQSNADASLPPNSSANAVVSESVEQDDELAADVTCSLLAQSLGGVAQRERGDLRSTNRAVGDDSDQLAESVRAAGVGGTPGDALAGRTLDVCERRPRARSGARCRPRRRRRRSWCSARSWPGADRTWRSRPRAPCRSRRRRGGSPNRQSRPGRGAARRERSRVHLMSLTDRRCAHRCARSPRRQLRRITSDG